jgi:hypothetical protein
MLDADSMFDAAARDAGLEEFGEPGMRKRFSAMIAKFNADGSVPGDKLAAAEHDFRMLVTQRLMVERDFRRFPEIASETVERPIFIVGGARTGTTILQCLLGLDENSQLLRYWQTHYPSPPPGTDPGSIAVRIASTDALVKELIALMPLMLPCHPYLDQGGMAEAEDEELFTLDFQSTYPFHFIHVPTLPIGSEPADPIAAFQFHKRMLQYLQWRSPRKRWVCKGPNHQFNLEALLTVYPDAICVWPHRHPAEFFGSMMQMVSILYGPITGRDCRPFARHFATGVKAAFDQVLSSRFIDDSRVLHLNFSDLMADPSGAIQALYQKCDMAFSPHLAQTIVAWLANPANASDRHGKFKYALEDFGYSRSEISDMFVAYCERFELTT